MSEPIDELVAWVRAEYARRTRAIAAGNGRIDWLDPGTRVSWSEVFAKAHDLGMKCAPVELRITLSERLKQ